MDTPVRVQTVNQFKSRMSTNPNTQLEHAIDKVFTYEDLQECWRVCHNNSHLNIYTSFQEWIRKAHNIQLPPDQHGLT